MESSRIRLEGRLETLEGALASLENGLAHARRLDFAPLVNAVALEQSTAVQEARAQADKLAANDPALRRLLRRMDALKAGIETRVAKRRRKLRLAPMPLLPAVQELSLDPIIYLGRPDWRWPIFGGWLGMMAVLWTIAGHWWVMPSWWPLFFLAASRKLQPLRVMVTRRRLVVRERSIELSKVRSVDFRPHVTWGDPQAIRMHVTLVGGERLEQNVPLIPDELVLALKAGGVEVTRS